MTFASIILSRKAPGVRSPRIATSYRLCGHRLHFAQIRMLLIFAAFLLAVGIGQAFTSLARHVNVEKQAMFPSFLDAASLFNATAVWEWADDLDETIDDDNEMEHQHRHPTCLGDDYCIEAYDATKLFMATLPPGMKAAFLHYKKNIYLWVFRAVVSIGAKRCNGPTHSQFGVWARSWDLEVDGFLTSALVSHDILTGEPESVLYSRHHHINGADGPFKIDGRLFRDDSGDIMLYHTVKVAQGATGKQVSAVSKVQVTEKFVVKKNKSKQLVYNITMEPEMVLNLEIPGRGISNSKDHSKNFIPWNGTSIMSYSHFPTFQPHSLLDWGSYSQPNNLTSFTLETEIPFVVLLQKILEQKPRFADKYARFSGGTPVILDDGSWLGVGHIATPASMWHDIRGTKEVDSEAFMVKVEGKRGHHFNDYFLFWYRFESTPPYRFTHISKAFKLPYIKGYDVAKTVSHAGVIFPMNLELFGKEKYMVSYGQDDSAVRVALFKKSQVQSLLMPIGNTEEITAAAANFEFCRLLLARTNR